MLISFPGKGRQDIRHKNKAMITVLSPAKGQDFAKSPTTKKRTMPGHLKSSKELIDELRKLDSAALQRLMNISDKIAALNIERYLTFATPFTSKNAKQALFAFQGDVYNGLDAEQFSNDELDYAQDHIRILSGLYGLLRPLDLIQPYRLEMKTNLKNPRGDNLYQFWGDSITQSINRALKSHSDNSLINLASNEYLKAVKPKLLAGRLINVRFKESKNGGTRIVAVFAKRARGMMARYIVQNRIENPHDIRHFDLAGYRFSKSDSDTTQMTFVRPQPVT